MSRPLPQKEPGNKCTPCLSRDAGNQDGGCRVIIRIFNNYFKLNISELRSRDGVQNEDKVAASSAAACSRDGSFP